MHSQGSAAKLSMISQYGVNGKKSYGWWRRLSSRLPTICLLSLSPALQLPLARINQLRTPVVSDSFQVIIIINIRENRIINNWRGIYGSEMEWGPNNWAQIWRGQVRLNFVASVWSESFETGSINHSSLKSYSKGIHRLKPNKTWIYIYLAIVTELARFRTRMKLNYVLVVLYIAVG